MQTWTQQLSRIAAGEGEDPANPWGKTWLTFTVRLRTMRRTKERLIRPSRGAVPGLRP